MPRRVTLTDRQKDALLRLPTSQTDLLKHYTLSDEDLGHIRLRRRAHNRFGFALQLCVLRYPGRVLARVRTDPCRGHRIYRSAAWPGCRRSRRLCCPRGNTARASCRVTGALRLPHLLRTWCERAEGMVVPRSRDGGVERGYRPSLRSRVPTHPLSSFPRHPRSSGFVPRLSSMPSDASRRGSPVGCLCRSENSCWHCSRRRLMIG